MRNLRYSTNSETISFSGKIVPGKGEAGKLLDHPTFNICPEKIHSLKNGMYCVKVAFLQKNHFGTMYVGNRPTFSDGNPISYEIHLFDYEDKSEQPSRMDIGILFFIRDEKKFETVTGLKQQQF